MLQLLSLEEKSYLSDEHIKTIAQNDVCSFVNKDKELVTGFLLANIKPNENVCNYLPSDLVPDDVITTTRSDLPRKLIQVPYFDASYELKADFHLVSSKRVNTLLTYERKKLVETTKQILFGFGVLNQLYITSNESNLMSYNARTKKFLINPEIFYTHLTRTLVLTKVNPEDALLVVVAHEIGHSLDEELNSKADEFFALANNIHVLYRKHEKNKLSKHELRNLRSQIQKYGLMNLQFETNAWNIGLKFIPSYLKEYYKDHSELMLFENRNTLNTQMEQIDFNLTHKI